MIYLVLILSFLLDGIIFSLFSFTDPISPLFTMLSLLIIYPYSDTTKKVYYVCPLVLGILYDIAYGNSLFLNTLIFLGYSYLLVKIFKIFTINFINVLIISNLSIVLYRTIICLFMHIIGIMEFNIGVLMDSITHSIISNFVYITTFYVSVTFLSSKFKIKKRNQ